MESIRQQKLKNYRIVNYGVTSLDNVPVKKLLNTGTNTDYKVLALNPGHSLALKNKQKTLDFLK